jgi:hypothetical protein
MARPCSLGVLLGPVYVIFRLSTFKPERGGNAKTDSFLLFPCVCTPIMNTWKCEIYDPARNNTGMYIIRRRVCIPLKEKLNCPGYFFSTNVVRYSQNFSCFLFLFSAVEIREGIRLLRTQHIQEHTVIKSHPVYSPALPSRKAEKGKKKLGKGT